MFTDQSPLERGIHALAKGMALLGGAALIGLVVLVVASVIGRALLWAGLRPVPGDYELVEAGTAFAVFAFLPWGHLERGHALVALLTDRFGPALNRWILVLTDAMMLAAAGFIAWRLWYGMLDKFIYRETTVLLRLSLGWAYAACFAGAVVFVIVALFVLGRSISNAVTGYSEPAQGAVEP